MNKKIRKKTIIIPTMLIITTFTMLIITISAVYWSAPSAGFSDFVIDKIVSSKQLEILEDSNIDDRFNNDLLNIAFLGFDKSSSSEQPHLLPRPDTIMIAAIDFKSAQVSLVSIPRDSYVKIYGTETFDHV